MNNEKIIKNLTKEIESKKNNKISFRISDDLHTKMMEYQDENDISLTNIIRIALINYFVENEIDN